MGKKTAAPVKAVVTVANVTNIRVVRVATLRDRIEADHLSVFRRRPAEQVAQPQPVHASNNNKEEQ